MNSHFNARILTRTAAMLGLAGAVVLTVAARPQAMDPTQATKAQPDSLLTIGALMEAATSAPVAAAPVQRATPTTAARTASGWPVDPQTGRTLVNGQPVIGRVFVMHKVDGIEAYQFTRVYANEPGHPQRPIVGTSYTKPSLAASRRVRGIMVQSTLWSMDSKRSARINHHYR